MQTAGVRLGNGTPCRYKRFGVEIKQISGEVIRIADHAAGGFGPVAKHVHFRCGKQTVRIADEFDQLIRPGREFIQIAVGVSRIHFGKNSLCRVGQNLLSHADYVIAIRFGILKRIPVFQKQIERFLQFDFGI
nr:hypothetical protein [Allobaculum sp. Allo2]